MPCVVGAVAEWINSWILDSWVSSSNTSLGHQYCGDLSMLITSGYRLVVYYFSGMEAQCAPSPLPLAPLGEQIDKRL